jgi:hypothetical protein
MLVEGKKPVFIRGEHDYDYTQNTENHIEVFRLYRSTDKAWASECRGELLMELRDTGNERIVEGKRELLFDEVAQYKENLSLSFNYSQIEELEILLRVARGNNQLNAFSIETITEI